MKKSMFLALVLALVATAVRADGEVYFQGSNSFGASVFSAGSANFTFGSANGGPAVFQGSAFTATGVSQIQGFIGFQANAFVPSGTVGTASAGGYVSHVFGAGHQGGAAYPSYSTHVQTWSNSSGEGSASSNVNIGGNAVFYPVQMGGGKG